MALNFNFSPESAGTMRNLSRRGVKPAAGFKKNAIWVKGANARSPEDLEF